MPSATELSLPRIKRPVQDKFWTCSVATWEYLTGIARQTIAIQLGHDGSTVVRPELGSPDDRSGVYGSEIIWWAYKHLGLSSVSVEVAESFQNRNNSGFHVNIHPTRAELIADLDGKAAELTVTNSGTQFAYHSVAWLGSFVLDPGVGIPETPDRFDIVGATILPAVSAHDCIDRLVRLTVKEYPHLSAATDWWSHQLSLTGEDQNREEVMRHISAALWRYVARRRDLGDSFILTRRKGSELLREGLRDGALSDFESGLPEGVMMSVTAQEVTVLNDGNAPLIIWKR